MSSVHRIGEEQPTPRILVVDDESFVREAIELYFMTEGYVVFSAANAEEALEVLERESVDVAILDILMPGMDGISLLREVKKRYLDIEVVMASGCGTIDSAIDSMRLGAYDYVKKPILNFDEDLLKVVRKALERRRLLGSNRKLANDLKEINRELKSSNTRLKRHLADLEVIYDTGRLLAEMEDTRAALDLTGATLRHQLGIEPALVLLKDPVGWQAYSTSGEDPGKVIAPVPADSGLLAANVLERESALVETEEFADLSKILEKAGLSPAEHPHAVLIPLKAGGDLVGLLVTLHPANAEPGEDRLRLLVLVTAILAAPLALLRERVSQ